jgi:zinc finger protein 830
MADVRALLKAKRQEARVTHPYATYSATGALRCAACGAAVKFASAWEGHLGSKAHRVAVANLKAKEEEAAKRAILPKRGAEDADTDSQMEEVEVDVPPPAKRQRTEERDVDRAAGIPMDFFSDPSRAPPTRDNDDDDGNDDEDTNTGEVGAPPKSQFDKEWAAFERDMQGLQQPAPDPQETYARATVAAEPELVPGFEGLPGQVPEGGGEEAAPASELEKKVSEEEERKRKVQEEHELIMDRLLEEERAQEEADSRVAALKSRVEMLKKKRELAKAKGNKAEART